MRAMFTPYVLVGAVVLLAAGVLALVRCDVERNRQSQSQTQSLIKDGPVIDHPLPDPSADPDAKEGDDETVDAAKELP